jgi:hypothetical protein
VVQYYDIDGRRVPHCQATPYAQDAVVVGSGVDSIEGSLCMRCFARLPKRLRKILQARAEQ